MKKKSTAVVLVLAIAATGAVGLAACEKKAGPGTQTAAGGCEHGIKKEKCPFCTPSLIESDGFCGEHGVAEALCYQCRPYLKTAFKAKGDWCKDHEAPESQCLVCHPELKEKVTGGHGEKGG